MSEGQDGGGKESGGAFLRIVRGDPSAEEVAALVAVLTARAQAAAAARGDAPGGAPVSHWADRSRLTRTPVPPRPGPGTWRASALP
ncbi:acyl-CoA carboxylase subunit epsilon [Actinomadura harenae]|uniref:Acyl-CoA carboxylase subunit epsilon n=1 Tax=Actinomadura harenae TaxID=2483351 RepID=A0A3M2MB97_9ACTN|nr:acyl-CoA carboxylase subunit epsilon [Actinomadura harenae]RMI47054.1 acyl-CoA carboxylase subunit epsilon [Actinomadura harenae]